jgi:Mg-chelatase subunit ChlD
MPEFAQPAALWLLALVPLALLARWRGGVPESAARRVAGSVLRAAALAALAVALAGPLASGFSRHTDLVFALDVSGSVGREGATQALDFINRAIAARDPQTRIGVVVFGADAAVESLVRADVQPLDAIASDVPREGSNLARAIEVAAGAFPPGQQRRVVLLSDGHENAGDARAAAAVARSIGVEIVAIPLQQDTVRDEVAIEAIEVPSQVRVHEPFEVRTAVHSARAGQAQLLILRNGQLLREVALTLTPGTNEYGFVEQADSGGLREYEAIVNSDRDTEQENNRYQAFVEVSGAPRVLHVVGAPGMQQHVSAALGAQGLDVHEVPATALPASMHELGDFELIILNNVSGFDLSLAKMELLERYVRDAGGGVVMLGGDRSYGAGGYFATPVERLLPVTMDVKSTIKIPTLSVVFVLDRSGSMGSSSHGEEKIEIAKSAAMSSIALLNPLDRVSVLAFDDESEWIVPPSEVGNRQPISEKLRALGAGGSTDLVRALDEAVRVMGEEQAKVKHLIVLSDGLTGIDADFTRFVAQVHDKGITVSTVALGVDADRALMSGLAASGQGRFYYTDDARDVPRIFTSETMVVARNLVVERDTRPLLRYPGELLAGFDAQAFPPLAGYMRTFARPAAQVLLATADDDPLLATWRYGLGKAVAFTSDLSGRWGRAWVQWDGFARFVAQTARWSMRRDGRETLRPRFEHDGERGEVVVDVLDADERFINDLDMRATVADPQRQTRAVALAQVAPGRYRGHFPLAGAGRYYVSLSGAAGELRVGPKTFGLAVPYSREFRDRGVDRALLDDVAAATGGAVLPLSATSLPALLAARAGVSGEHWRVWWPLLFAALALLVLEIAVRKLVAPPSWRAWWARRTGRARADAETAADLRDLRANINAAREAHLAALAAGGDGRARRHDDDPAAVARLYVARRRGAG